MRRTPVVAIAVVTALVVTAAALPTATGPLTTRAEAAPGDRAGDVVELRPVSTTDRRFVDDAGRQLLLRGANVNSLGEYWQGVPGLDPTIPLSDADWDLMAARGFSVVRLLVTWSRVEPTRDVIDDGYLDQVAAAVEEAAARGIYTVIDMHQDAYSAFISTTDPTSCPPGTVPAKGWDGAPAWAVRTDGLSTCLPAGADRNASPAVTRAWQHFYDDTDGIRTEFAEAWGAVAARFAGRPEVAGYDLLNEPENPWPAAVTKPKYDALLGDVVGAIAESAAPFDHVVFLEPALPAADLANGLLLPDPAASGIATDDLALAFHNYAESILQIPGLTIEVLNDAVDSISLGLGIPNWGGEYGFWDTAAETLATARRYAADEDRLGWGGAWWQWRQSCGDPHGVRWVDGQVQPDQGTSTHLNLLGCPGNVDLGPNDAFLDILGRGYARAVPGRLVELVSDPTTGVLAVTGAVDEPGGELVVWTPTAEDPAHRVRWRGLVDVVEHVVPGGRLVTATVAGSGEYELRVGGEALPSPPTTTTTTLPPGEPGASPAEDPPSPPSVALPARRQAAGDVTSPALPVRAAPAFTG